MTCSKGTERLRSTQLGSICRLVLLAFLWTLPVQAATLTRGVNITNWFRYPASRDPAVLAAYVSDQALTDLQAAGFDFVRLAVDPEIVSGTGLTTVLIAAIQRIEAHGMAVIVSPHPRNWNLEAHDRDRLPAFWQELAPKLATLDQTQTLPEVVNEPVFPNDPAAWAALQHRVLSAIRQALPQATVVLTGQDWGSVGGLLALTPEPDQNVLYSFHFYDPAELTALASYRQDIDHAVFARLPFPVADPSRCDAVADQAADATTRDVAKYYCTVGWDAERIAAPLDQAAAWATLHRVHLLAGEFGASVQLNTAARLAWLKTVRMAFQARSIPWALWGYEDTMGFALPQPLGSRPVLNPDVLSALGITTAK